MMLSINIGLQTMSKEGTIHPYHAYYSTKEDMYSLSSDRGLYYLLYTRSQMFQMASSLDGVAHVWFHGDELNAFQEASLKTPVLLYVLY